MRHYGSLPPLTALLAADAAARAGSITAAASQLGVTPPAVSQQIKLLEDHLGRKLFDRSRKGLTPTDAGRAVLPHLAEGFASLFHVTLIGSDRLVPGRIVISAPASVAVKWLPHVAATLKADDPDLAVELRMEEDPVDFGEGGPDIRIGYGELPYAGVERDLLVRDFLIPVCAPDFDLNAKSEGFIHTDWGASYASLPVWRDWARLTDKPAPDPRRGLKAGAATLALDMAMAGLGIALGNALYGGYDITAGRLRIPFGPAVPMGAPYTICYRGRQPHIADLVARIRTVAERDMAAANALVDEAIDSPFA